MKKLLVLILFSSFVYSQDYAKGKELFKTHCAACHNMERKMVGPALKDIVERQGKDWTKKWIYNNNALRDSGDEYAIQIWEEYNKAAMPGYQFLKDEELNNIVEYLALYQTKKDEAAAKAAAPPTAVTGGQIVVNTEPTPIYVYFLLGDCLIIVIVALYAFYVGLRHIGDITSKTQSTNLYLMRKLHMDQNKVDNEIDTLITKKVNEKVTKKVKKIKKEINNKLKNFN